MWWTTREYIVIIFKLALSFVQHGIGNVLIRFWPGIERPVVEVRQGKVRGVTSELPNGRKYHFFKGIPYAKPPIGELRFRPPVPVERFNEPIINCSSDKGDFVQPHIILNWPVVGSEDGLYLNVYTPGLPPSDHDSTKYPVMVYIHGGGLRFGTASSFIYDPKYLVQRDVIVVTMFYRLGPLGFLSLPSVGINGNMGLKDQRLALQWVHENIAQFGGDVDNVTLFGESAGSWSTYLHYLSPNSRKFFHRVICQSGDSCTESAFQVDPEGKARKLAQLLGCRGSTDQDVLDTLMKAPASSLAKLQNHVISSEETSCPMRFLFRPVIERELTEDSIITQTPEQVLKSFDTIKMPIMSGNCSAEGNLALNLNKYCLDEFNKNVDRLVPRFMITHEGLDRQAVSEEVKRFYLGDKKICWEAVEEVCALLSDFTFVGTSNLSAEWIAKYQPNVKHYHYLFNFTGQFNLMKPLLNCGTVSGAAHGDDNFYLFSPKVLPKVSDSSDESKMRNIFIEVFTNFAKFNNPTPDETTLGIQWKPISPVPRDSESFDIECLELNVPPRLIKNPSQERKEFWRAMLKKHTNLL